MKLSELKNGAVVELRNGDRCLKVDNTFLNLDSFGMFMKVNNYGEDLKIKNDDFEWDIVKVNNDVENSNGYLNSALYGVFKRNKWTWEEPKEILTDKEKEYLKAVCKPFDVEYIVKYTIFDGEEYISISLTEEVFHLPSFEQNTMYKGMEIDREYTLEELGI